MVNVQVANRVTIPQLEFLAQCMERFPSLALASFGKSREETNCAHKKWLQIGSALNKIKPGVTKTGLGWLRYWTNYKYQLRKRYPQFRWSWVNNEFVRVTPLERRFLQVLADHEKSQPPQIMFQSDQNTEKYPTIDEEEKDHITVNYPQRETSQTTPTKQIASQSMPTTQENSHSMPTMQENSHSVPTIQDISQPLHKNSPSLATMKVVDIRRERNMDLTYIQDDNEKQDVSENSSKEDPIGTRRESKEEIQLEILKFHLKRQREMHELEMTQMKERHRIEVEILELKKKKLMQEYERLTNNVFKSINH